MFSSFSLSEECCKGIKKIADNDLFIYTIHIYFVVCKQLVYSTIHNEESLKITKNIFTLIVIILMKTIITLLDNLICLDTLILSNKIMVVYNLIMCRCSI